MDYVVKEVRYRDVAEDYKRLSERAYPYQRPEMVEISYRSWISRVKTHAPVRFFSVYQGNETVLIAPLKVKNDGVYVLGTLEGYNMSDFVYNTEDCDQLVDVLISLFHFLKNQVFAGKRFIVNWWYLYDETLSWKALHKMSDEGVIKDFWPVAINNVQIPLKEDYDTYYKGLSKHARQNIRTAYNRANRNNFTITFHVYPMSEGEKIKASARKAYKQYSAIYMKRLAERYDRKGLTFLVRKILARFFNSGWRSASTSFSLLVDISLNDKVAAYAKCYLDLAHKKITVPNLAIDSAFGFYSPGIILVNELAKYIINLGDVEYLSMGRGEEPYKYEMGGEVYHTYYCQFSFE